jgi:DNA polymerase-3 subunit epsilon
MERYSTWYGDWSDYLGDYRYQALPGGDHTAAGDCLATLRVLTLMAHTGEDQSDADGASLYGQS